MSPLSFNPGIDLRHHHHNQDAELSQLPETSLGLFGANMPHSRVRTLELRARSIYILGGGSRLVHFYLPTEVPTDKKKN